MVVDKVEVGAFDKVVGDFDKEKDKRVADIDLVLLWMGLSFRRCLRVLKWVSVLLKWVLRKRKGWVLV
jgi:hypothetical protein